MLEIIISKAYNVTWMNEGVGGLRGQGAWLASLDPSQRSLTSRDTDLMLAQLAESEQRRPALLPGKWVTWRESGLRRKKKGNNHLE